MDLKIISLSFGTFGVFVCPNKPVEYETPNFNKNKNSLHPPPRARQILTLGSLVLVGVLALLVATALLPSALYALKTGKPHDLGELAEAQLPTTPEWITTTGLVKREALSFRRYGSRGSFRLSQIEGREEIWVVLPVPAKAEEIYVPPTRFTGRLTEISSEILRNRPITQIINASKPAKVEKFLLFHGQTPQTERDSLWGTALLALIGLCSLLFATRLAMRIRPQIEEKS